MRMREYQVFFRWMCGRDIVNDGSLVSLVDELESLMERPFARWRALGRPAQELDWTVGARLQTLDSTVGAGRNQELRMRLTAGENCAGVVSLEVQAQMHPYTGRYVTTVDLRVHRDVLVDDEVLGAWGERFAAWVEDGDAIWAHAHDADDDAIQNVFDPNLLRLGYGVELAEGTDLMQNPGREVSRGEFRYVVNWLTWFGPEMCAELRLRERDYAIDGLSVLPLERGYWFSLAPSPLNPDDDEVRARQRALRELLEIPALAERTRRAFGFWQRR